MSKVTNQTADIDGAQPRKPFYYTNVAMEDVQGSKPMATYHTRFSNKPDSFLVHDIDGARPRTNMFRTSREVDPLQPEYKLPSFEPVVYEEPRFLRDSFNVDDISGTKPRQPRVLQTRNSYDVADIEGANASWKRHHVRLIEKLRAKGGSQRPATLDVSDITSKGFKSQRCTNPLQPVYRVHGKDVFDCPKGTRPKPLTRESQSPFFSLHTDDVKGAKGGSASVFQRLRVHERTYFRDTNNVQDIPGAVTNTLRRGLRSNRQTNPLGPRYTYLHGASTPTPPPESEQDLLRSLDKHKHPAVASRVEPSSRGSARGNDFTGTAPPQFGTSAFSSSASSNQGRSASAEVSPLLRTTQRPPNLSVPPRAQANWSSGGEESANLVDSAFGTCSARTKTSSARRPQGSSARPSSARSASARSARTGSGRRSGQSRTGLDATEPVSRSCFRPATARETRHPTGVHMVAPDYKTRKVLEKHAEIEAVKDLPSWF